MNTLNLKAMHYDDFYGLISTLKYLEEARGRLIISLKEGAMVALISNVERGIICFIALEDLGKVLRYGKDMSLLSTYDDVARGAGVPFLDIQILAQLIAPVIAKSSNKEIDNLVEKIVGQAFPVVKKDEEKTVKKALRDLITG